MSWSLWWETNLQSVDIVMMIHVKMVEHASNWVTRSAATVLQSGKETLVTSVSTIMKLKVIVKLKLMLYCSGKHDGCASSPCRHGGTCINSGDRATCLCRDGFEGILCEKDINDCNPYPWWEIVLHGQVHPSTDPSTTFSFKERIRSVSVTMAVNVLMVSIGIYANVLQALRVLTAESVSILFVLHMIQNDWLLGSSAMIT